MSDKLIALLMPHLSETMTEEDKTKFFAVLDYMLTAELDDTGKPILRWANTQRGRYRQAGNVVAGDQIKIVSRTFSRQQVAWMLITRQPLWFNRVLQAIPLWPGDDLRYWDLRTWRMYPDRKLLTHTPPNQLRFLPYYDCQGVLHTPTKKR